MGFDLQESGSHNMTQISKLYDEWLNTQPIFKPVVLMDTFVSSFSTKTFINIENNAMFSFSISEFFNEKTAEIFFINKQTFDLNLYISILRCIQNCGIRNMVVQKNSFWLLLY